MLEIDKKNSIKRLYDILTSFSKSGPWGRMQVALSGIQVGEFFIFFLYFYYVLTPELSRETCQIRRDGREMFIAD